jgi:DNA polymerase-1
MNKAIIDGDMIVYRSAFGSEHEIKWDDDVYTLHLNMREAFDKCTDIIDSICKRLDTTDYILAFSPSVTFRHNLFPDYKANRKDKRKPLGLRDLVDKVFTDHNGKRVDNIEADDLIGIMCTGNDSYVACSGDKDFATLPCRWYNFIRDEYSERTHEEADYNHLIQALAGDPTDNYMGVKGIGVKTADKLLKQKGATWQTVVDIYKSKELTEYDALLNARLAYILRCDDYDEATGKINLWKPKNYEPTEVESTGYRISF